MHSCLTSLKRSRSSFCRPERKYCTIRLFLLSTAMLLSRRWSTAFRSSSNEIFHTKICHICDFDRPFKNLRRCLSSFDSDNEGVQQIEESMLVAEGLFAVDKPLDWTSNDVVTYIRGILEKDARARGFKVDKVSSKQRRYAKKNTVKCGHGGTLDPLATGVLVIGVGQGTKMLQDFLKGTKGYRAAGEFGFETDTLDMAGTVIEKAGFDHITREKLEEVIPKFVGEFMQYPPLYSAIHMDGKRLYELAREGMTTEELDVPPRQVTVMNFDLLGFDLPKFEISVQCGGGTYIRSLIRDIGYSLDSVATTTLLQRTKQGPFTLEHTLPREEWTAGNIYKAIETTKQRISDFAL